MTKKFLLSILLVYHSYFLLVQQDSVIAHLDKLKDNSQKIDYLIETAHRFYAKNDTVRALFYLRKSVSTAYENHIASNKANYALGEILFRNSDYEKELNFLEKSRILSEGVKDELREAKALVMISLIYLTQGKNVDKTLKYSKKAMLIAHNC